MAFRIYFWELTGDQISILLFGNFASVIVALFLAPRIAAKMGKKSAAIMFAILAIVLSPIAYIGRLLDVLPENGDPVLVAILFFTSFVNTILTISPGIVGASMIADIVEDYASRTRKFSAGLFFSSNSFVLKSLSGVGVFGAGLILDFVSFPEGAKVGSVPQDVLTNMALTEVPVLASLQIISLLFIVIYPITRSRHEVNLRKIREEDQMQGETLGMQNAKRGEGRNLSDQTAL